MILDGFQLTDYGVEFTPFISEPIDFILMLSLLQDGNL